jgi:hypothetical protein
MGRAEEKYEYLSKRDKYDPEVREAVGNKSLTEKDANKVNKIQEMMRKEREKKGSRNIVTSENREEFMKKKLKLADKEKEIRDKPETKDYSKMNFKDRPHGIFHSGTDKLHSHHENHDKAYEAYQNLGSKMFDYAIGELTTQERKEHKYE